MFADRSGQRISRGPGLHRKKDREMACVRRIFWETGSLSTWWQEEEGKEGRESKGLIRVTWVTREDHKELPVPRDSISHMQQVEFLSLP